APEQHAAGTVTPAADQFSWCVALWEGLSGEHPFAGADGAAIARSIVIGRRRPSTPLGVPRRVRRALERGLASDPAQRHASIEALLREVSGPRRRFEVWLGGILALGLSALALSRSPAEPCATPLVRPPPWPAAERAALSQTMAESPLRAGPELFARVEAAVDTHWARWRDAEHEACTAASGEVDSLADVHACLDVDALRMTETLRQLAHGGPDTQSRALELVHAVGRPEDCTAPRTNDADRVANIESELRDAVVRSQTALAAGALAAARREAEPVVASDDDRAVAEAALVLASVAAKRSEFDASAKHGERALASAIRAGASDVAARVAAHLVFTEAQRGQLGLAERWYGRARAWSKAVGDPARLRARVWSQWGLALRDARRFDEAQRVLRDALAELRDPQSRAAASEVAVLAHLGSTLRAMNRYDDADALLREADALCIAELGVDHPHRIIVLLSRQVLAKQQGRLDDSLALAHEALRRVTAWVGADSARAGEVHVNIGNIHTVAGRFDEAEAHFRKGLEVFTRDGNTSARRLLAANLSQLALQRTDTEEALRWTLEEIELLDALDQPNFAVQAYSRLSHIHALGNDVEAATAAIERAVEWMEQAYDADDPHRAVPWSTLGRLQLQRQEPEAALETLSRAAALLRRNEHGEAHPAWDAVELYRGVALVSLGRYEEAVPVAVALAARPLAPGFDAGVIQRLVAEARAGAGDHEGALAAIDRAVSSFRESGDQAQLNDAEALRDRWRKGAW
ncbi:MAG: tetratricopeptide repeat protein, partial [Myxococcota bacterium]